MTELEYNTDEIESLKQWLKNVKEAGEFTHAEFEVAPGVTVDFDWSLEKDEPMLPISVIVWGRGFGLFTRGTGDTLTETGSYGWGENHGDTLSADISTWIYKSFTEDFDEIVFEYSDNYNGDAWLFQGWVPNPLLAQH